MGLKIRLIVRNLNLVVMFLLVGVYLYTLASSSSNSIRNYDKLLESLKVTEGSKVEVICSVADTAFDYRYQPYSFIENPISFVLNKLHFGVSQIADPIYLYEHHKTGFCGQQSQFFAKLASDLGMDYRYVLVKAGHVALEVKLKNGAWVFLDPTKILTLKDTKYAKESYATILTNDAFEVISDFQHLEGNLENVDYHEVNQDMFWKLNWFNRTAYILWFFGVPIYFFFGVILARKLSRLS